MPEQVPSLNRNVHFVYGDKHYAALITDPAYPVDVLADDPRPSESYQALVVFPPMEASFTTVAPYSADPVPGTWHWPEFVPPKP